MTDLELIKNLLNKLKKDYTEYNTNRRNIITVETWDVGFDFDKDGNIKSIYGLNQV